MMESEPMNSSGDGGKQKGDKMNPAVYHVSTKLYGNPVPPKAGSNNQDILVPSDSFVWISWFNIGAPKRTSTEYSSVIQDYDRLPVAARGMMEECVDETFSDAEAHALERYLSRHPFDSVKVTKLPLPMEYTFDPDSGRVTQSSLHYLRNIKHVPLAIVRLAEVRDYNLSFKVYGLYNLLTSHGPLDLPAEQIIGKY